MATNENKGVRKPTFWEGMAPLIFMAIVLGIGKVKLNASTDACLLLSALFAGFIAIYRLGYTWVQLEGFIINKISAVMQAILIVLFVGFMVATWSFSGTMPMIVYYGIELLNPQFLYAFVFVSTAILAYVSGASWGAVASIGVALISVAEGLDLNLAITAAAAVTGSYFGDKLSPLSDTTNLAAAVAQVPLYDHIKYMLWTTVPGTILSIIIFTLMGLNQDITAMTLAPETQTLLTQITEIYKFGFWPIVPMLVILICVLLQFPTVPSLIASGISGILVGTFVQGFDWLYGVNSAINGFNIAAVGIDPATLAPNVIDLLNRGGVSTQGGFVSLVFCAMGFAGIVAGTGMMEAAVMPLTKGLTGVGPTIVSTGVLSVAVTALASSDGLAKVITGELMLAKFLRQRIHPVVFARTLEDFGTMAGPLIPWAVAGTYMTTTLGVSTWEYFPYCFLSFFSMIAASAYAMTGFKIKRITDEEAVVMAAERGITLEETSSSVGK